jgi:hypothetical protein
MKDAHDRREPPSPGRFDARRRAAQADVANYIHELSDRHVSAEAAGSAPVPATSREARCDGP